MGRMRRLCFGGSFNPIHLGHLQCAFAAARAGGFQRVVLIPNAISPHKLDAADAAPASDRLAMCKLGAAEWMREHAEAAEVFEIDDLELLRPFPSYTIDTVRELKRRGWVEVHWLIGADQLGRLPSWHEAESLVSEAIFWVIGRPGAELDFQSLPEAFQSIKSRILAAPLIEISASEIRQRVGRGESIGKMVPAAVEQYIARHGLYRNPAA